MELDRTAALAWYRKAALRGDGRAMNAIGCVFLAGDVHGARTAAVWFEKAAALGHADAMVPLGGMYHGGVGVMCDPVAAAAWYGKTADRGHPRPRLAIDGMSGR